MLWGMKQELPAMQKMVLMAIANRFNDDMGYCFPSHELLAKESGMSKSSVLRQIEALEKTTLLSVIRSLDDKGNKNVNRYILKVGASVTVELPLVSERNEASVTVELPLVSERNEASVTVTHETVNEPVSINQKDNHKESAPKKAKLVLPEFIDQATWDEWMTVRKKKGAVISETSTNRLLSTLAKVEADAVLSMNGITPNEAIAIAIEQSWKGLNIEWLHNRLKQQGGANATHKQYNKPARLSAPERVEKAIAERNKQRMDESNVLNGEFTRHG